MADVDVSWEFRDLFEAIYNAPTYHLVFEACLILFIVRLLFQHSFRPKIEETLTKDEEEMLIAEWKSDPLVPSTFVPNPSILSRYEDAAIDKISRTVVMSDGKVLLNFATFNFLDFIGNKRIEERALDTLRHYGVGSCGPRGFYGTMDVHLKLEEQLEKFFDCEEAVLYSYGFSTIASAIPAYAKRHDVIFADAGCCFAIQKGLEASRSKILYFNHNDMDHLESLLQKQLESDRKNPKKAKVTRKFIVVEGLYVNYGDTCPLQELVQLKYKFKVRLFLEESISLGTLGSTGRGICEELGVSPMDIDLIAAGIENSLATQGGFVIGTKYVVDHQRLSGLGYCFSASLPPMLAAAASEALNIMEEEKGERVHKLRKVSQLLQKELLSLKTFSVSGLEFSPIKHVRLIKDNNIERLEKICELARSDGLLFTVCRYLDKEVFLPEPSIRLSLNCNHTDSDIKDCIRFLKACTDMC